MRYPVLTRTPIEQPMMTLSATGQINRDMYLKIKGLFEYPTKMELVFGGYKPDLYFTISPSSMMCYHSERRCVCEFHVIGVHPVTIGSNYSVRGNILRRKVMDLLKLIEGDYVWSDCDGLMSRVDGCRRQQGALEVNVEPSDSLKTSFIETTTNTVKSERHELEVATPLIRGQLAYKCFIDKVLSQYPYAGTMLTSVHLKVKATRVNCRHENCQCIVTVTGDMAYSHSMKMGKNFLETIEPMLQIALLWYNCHRKLKIEMIQGVVYSTGSVQVTEPMWRPAMRDSSVWEMSLAAGKLQYPADIVNTIITAMMTARPQGNLLRYADRLSTQERHCVDGAGGGHVPDITNLEDVEYHLFQSSKNFSWAISCTGVSRDTWDQNCSTVIRVTNFDYSFIRITEGWPSCYESVGHAIEDMPIMCDMAASKTPVILLPPMPEVFSPWVTLYNSTGGFMSFGLKTAYPLDPRSSNGICGDVMSPATYYDPPNSVVKYNPKRQRAIPELLWHRAMGQGYYYCPIQQRDVEVSLMT